ncbi:hypothetical protein TWF788_006164 [Orbilia oligospora]|uniref:Uncharacterized protein n=1 Tax=Orbilia oligospora TaxID=2813651 RepID=A0A7C8Q3E4_ORBOL|nr:hypothetical protein TWF788_006164 [Orbilia oligospora]
MPVKSILIQGYLVLDGKPYEVKTTCHVNFQNGYHIFMFYIWREARENREQFTAWSVFNAMTRNLERWEITANGGNCAEWQYKVIPGRYDNTLQKSGTVIELMFSTDMRLVNQEEMFDQSFIVTTLRGLEEFSTSKAAKIPSEGTKVHLKQNTRALNT